MVSTSVRSAIVVASALAPGSVAQLFTVNCAPLTLHRGDPILFPGVMSPHVHAVVGGTRFALNLTNEQARQAKATTCDKRLDKSNYWQPQLYHQRRDGRFELVEMQGIVRLVGCIIHATLVLALHPLTTNRLRTTLTELVTMPPARKTAKTHRMPGLRQRGCAWLSGIRLSGLIITPPGKRSAVCCRADEPGGKCRTYNHSNPEQRAISHVCLGANGGETPHLPAKQCDRMRAETFFPSCWDGRNLDSGDHKSHMAFPAVGDYNTGVCPQSHPVAILSVFFEFFYNTRAVKDFNRWVWAMGDVTGYGLHGDYLNGWADQGRLDRAVETCTGPNGVNDAGCSLNVGPDGPGRSSRQPVEVAPPNEEIGFNGPLHKLPGDNRVTGHPVQG
ncbi:hypothetical protein J3458_000905 [Metarhizium acridum]|uniref:uncharacterized protein n=1 Tax=Metarhizium acridum TaxID=92637 RepID=UPI001C6CB2E2|nr:hypothetical protein J3458_000905 [Metarhizium acridum]